MVGKDKKRILVIEDDETLRLNIEDYLVEENFDVFTAENGLKGVKLAYDRLPDLIISDIAMPKMDGFQVFEELQKNEFTSVIPFIFLTAKVNKEDFLKGINIGADDYITKPFSFDRLIAVINTKISKFEAINYSNEQKYRSLVENSLTGVFISQNGEFVYFNPKFCKIFGISDVLINKKIRLDELFENSDLEKVKKHFQNCISSETDDFHFECSAKTSADKSVRIEIFGGKSKFEGNYAIIGNILDVTDNFELSMKILEREKEYKDLLHLVPAGIIKCDLDGKIVYANTQFLKLLEYDTTEIYKMEIWDFASSENDKSILLDFYKNSVTHKSPPVPFITNKKTKTGKIIKAEIIWDYIKNPDGIISGFIQIIVDATEKEANRLALEESEMRFRSVAEVSNDWIWEIDLDGKYTYASERVFDILGYTPEELYGKSPVDFVEETDKEKVIEHMNYIYKNKETFKYFENRCVHKNGSEIIADTSGVPIFDEYSNLIGYRGVDTDVTTKRVADNRVKEMYSRLTILLDNLPNILLYECKGPNVFISENIFLFLGVTKKILSLSPEFLYTYIYDEDREKTITEINTWFEKKEVNSKVLEYRMKKNNGEIIWVEDRMKIVETEEGNHFITGVLINISERKKFEDKILKFSRAVEQSPSGIMIIDETGECEYVNRRYCEITGIEQNEIIGKKYSDFNLGKENENKYNNIYSDVKNGMKWEQELMNTRKNGDSYWESITIVPITNDKSEFSHFLIILQDISERKIAEEEIKNSMKRSEEANMIKSALFNNLSHEFRTPLNAILGYSEILQEDISDLDKINMCKEIYQSGQRLLNTLSSILRLAQIESLDYPVNLSKAKLSDELKLTYNTFVEEANAKNLEYKLEINSPDTIVNIDRNLLKLALSYIIDNSIKYTEKGFVKVSLNSYKDDGKNLAMISISDSGIGIPFEKQELIFREFRQASEGLSRSYEGSGLGLTIAKRFIELMNGSINVESLPNSGSTFYIVFNLFNQDK